MSITVDKLILDAKRIAVRLKERTTMGETLIVETEVINEQLESLRKVQDEFEGLNQLGRNNTNYQLVTAINQEHPHIREIQMENRELRACLQDHQKALEQIMSKYREHTQKKILNSQITFQHTDGTEFNNKYVDKILEMAAVMRKAAQIDEDNANIERNQDMLISRLITENKGLREILQISQTYGSTDKSVTPSNAITAAATNELDPSAVDNKDLQKIIKNDDKFSQTDDQKSINDNDMGNNNNNNINNNNNNNTIKLLSGDGISLPINSLTLNTTSTTITTATITTTIPPPTSSPSKSS